MTWWAEAERDFIFTCEDGHETYATYATKDAPDTLECAHCGKVAKQTRFSSVSFGAPMVKTYYEQNGRKAVKYRNSDGRTSHISESKLRYMETGKTDGVYTDSYNKQEIENAATRERKRQHLIDKHKMGRKK